MTTAVKKCTCASKFQDKTYGPGLRLMNKTEKTPAPVYRCTVCGKEH